MSWHGFKKAVNRAGIQKTGVVEKTSDIEFAGEERRVKECEKRVERAQRDGKACLDAMKILTAAKIIEDLNEMELGRAEEVPRYKEMLRMMDEMVNNEQVLLQPTIRLAEVIKKAQEGIKKRSNKLLDYDQARSKTRRAGDINKQQKAEAEEQLAKVAFDALDLALREDLPRMYAAVDGVLKEGVAAATKLQGVLVREIADGLTFIPDPPHVSPHQMDAALEEIRALRIAQSV